MRRKLKIYLLVEGVRGAWPDEPYKVIEVYSSFKVAFNKLKRTNKDRKRWVQTWIVESR